MKVVLWPFNASNGQSIYVDLWRPTILNRFPSPGDPLTFWNMQLPGIQLECLQSTSPQPSKTLPTQDLARGSQNALEKAAFSPPALQLPRTHWPGSNKDTIVSPVIWTERIQCKELLTRHRVVNWDVERVKRKPWDIMGWAEVAAKTRAEWTKGRGWNW